MTTTPHPMTTPPTIVATALAKMDHRPVNPIDPVGPRVPQVSASSTFSMALPVNARHAQRRPHTPEQMSPSGSTTDASGSQPAKINTRGPCRQLKTTKVTQVTNDRIIIRYDERHRVAPTAEQHSTLAHNIGHVVRTFCPMWWKFWKEMQDKTNYNFDNIKKAHVGVP
ncbi:hypothetical protein ACFX1Q_005375 [Malus domestica]